MLLRRFMPLLLPGLLLVQCAPAGMVAESPAPAAARIQKEPELVVTSQAQLSAALKDWIACARNPVHFRLAAPQKGNWRQFSGEALWGEYARRCSVTYVEETGLVSLGLEYRDYVRLRAALHDSAFRATLSKAEEHVLKQVETRTLALLKPGMSDFDKLLAVHDYLVQHGRYDAGAGGNVADLLDGGSGSCEAYSAAMCVMLEFAGIPARFVTGDADGPHAWNMVKLGKTWYHVDATWDDPVLSNSGTQVVSHSYFCCTDAEMSQTHRWNRAAYPVCNGTGCYYYRSRGLYFTSFAAYWRAAMAAWRRGEARFEGYLTAYGSSETFRAALQQYVSDDTPSRISWTGPETASGPVILTFGS